MHGGGLYLFALLLIGVPSLFAARMAFRARARRGGRPANGGGLVSGWLSHRRALRLERVRHENAAARDKAKHEHRLREQAERDARAGHAGDGTPRRTVRGKVVRLGDGPAAGSTPPDAARRPSPPQDGTPPPPGPPPAPAGTGGPEHRPHLEPPARGAESREGGSPGTRPEPGLTAPPPLEGKIVSTQPASQHAASQAPGVEQAVEGMRVILAHAMSGNIQSKRAAVLALAEVNRRSGLVALTLARHMAEPGRHYGPEVTERVAAASAHCTASATVLAEADMALLMLLNSSLAETMASGRQVPHHDELSETGSR